MPKKKPVAKRLKKLFQDLDPEAISSELEKSPGQFNADIPAAVSTHLKAGPFSPNTRPIEMVRRVSLQSESGLSMALQIGQNNWATLQVVDETDQKKWSPDDELLVRQVADQLSLALENAQLFKETQARAQELTVLNEVGQALTATLNIQQITEIIYRGISQLFDAKNFYIAFYDKEKNEVVFPHNVTESVVDRSITRVPLGKGITAHMIRTRESIRITDGSDKWMEEHGEIPVGEPARSFLGVPLVVGENVLGAIAIQDYQSSNRYDEHDLRLFTSFASQVAIAIENARLFEEINQRQKAQERSEVELRALFQAMNDVVIVYDKNGRYTRIAPTNPSLLVRAPLEMLGKTIHEILPKNLHEPFMSTIHQVLAGGETSKFEYQLPLGEKEYWFEANVSKLTDEEVFWVARDITERKKSEEALRQHRDHLAASSEISRLITSTLDVNTIFTRTVKLVVERFGFYHAAIFINEESGFNTYLREGTGSAGEIMKTQRHTLAIGSNSIVGQVAATGRSIVVNDTLIEPIHRHNPLLPKTRAEAGIPLRVGAKIVGVIDIQSETLDAFTEDDISVLQSLADQIAISIDNARSFELSQKALVELREVDRVKSQFLANMSHELRTPLNSIIGFSRVILKGIDGPVTDMQQQDLTAIYNSGQHLLGLINDILDLARIEAGKMELNLEEIQLSDMVNSVLSTAKGLVKEKPIQLVTKVPANIPTVRGDTMRIRQVFINLLSNASKFTDEGSITVEAHVQKSPAGRLEALVNVVDTGPGISLEDQEKLFKAFSQVDGSATRKSGGSGLGLSICANLVQLHGGRIGVHSEAGRGSTFWFTIPLYDQPLSDFPRGRKIVLAIDDDPQVIGLYERYLTPQGYHVVPLNDPSKAKQRIIEIKPYAITLDILMPNTDGWTLLTKLKSDPDTRGYPVIVCSILEKAEKGFTLGAADYLIKPILEEDLVQALNRMNRDGIIREILVIDDDLLDLRLMEKILRDEGQYKPILAEGGRKGWELINAKKPEAIILDVFMADMDGFTILEKMRENPALQDIPVLVISGGRLTNEQQIQLKEFEQRVITKGSFKDGELFSSIVQALRRMGN